MDVISTILVIYAVLCLRCTLVLIGAQKIICIKEHNQILRGEEATLTCYLSRKFQFSNCQWFFTQKEIIEERPLTNTTRYKWSCDDNPDDRNFANIRISFKNATFSDSGIYTCEVVTASEAIRQNMSLTVQDKPTVTVNESNYSIGTGDNLTLHCSIDWNGATYIRAEWTKESKQFQPSLRVFWNISSPSLKINNAELRDAGNYTCIGVTELGTTWSSKIGVQIFPKPLISVASSEFTHINGTNVTLEVEISPRMQTLLSVQWVKYIEENQEWFPLQNNSRLVWTYSNPSLAITTALVEDDGKYRIIAKTAYHEVTSSPITLTIHVQVKIKKIETRPLVIHEGDTVEIRCLVDGRPEPKVKWRLVNGTMIDPSNLGNEQGNILILERVTNLNEGNYTCNAQNNFSEDESLVSFTVLPVVKTQDADLTASPLEHYVVPSVSVVVGVALIAVIVVVILVRRKRQKGRTENKPSSKIRRNSNGHKQLSPSENICSGNGQAKFYVSLSGDMTYAQVIRKSKKDSDRKCIGDTNILPSNTHINGSNSTKDNGTPQVYMNINNTYATVQHRSSTSNSNNYIHEETESENTPVNVTEELNYTELDFSSNPQCDNSSDFIRGIPSTTTYADVVVFTR